MVKKNRLRCYALMTMTALMFTGCARDTESHRKPSESTEITTQAVESTAEATKQADDPPEIVSSAEYTFYNYTSKETLCDNNGKKIYGKAWIPEKEGKLPLVIISHGLASNSDYYNAYARELALHGVAAYTFDFCGGSSESRSDGETTDMSILTEVSDLEAVLTMVGTWDFIDTDRIVLMGESQGAVVSAVVAAKNKDSVAGLIQTCPAYIIFDKLHELSPALEYFPESFVFIDQILVGKKYVDDVWEYDVFNEIKGYDHPVLMLAGDSDPFVSEESVQPAIDIYKDVEYYVIKDGEHGFIDDAQYAAYVHIFDYLKKIDCF